MRSEKGRGISGTDGWGPALALGAPVPSAVGVIICPGNLALEGRELREEL